MKLRDYQIDLAMKGEVILKQHHLLYLAMEMRVGKTMIALTIAKNIKAKRVLFLTKKKAITEIIEQHKQLAKTFQCTYSINITNYEQLNKVEPGYDLIICDESHCLGSYPKPSLKTKRLKKIAFNSNIIYLSGTPSPESFSQLYHQFWISRNSPFGAWESFYKWAKSGFVDVKEKRISGHIINDYSNADEKQIKRYTNHLFLSYTQREAGFKVQRLNDTVQYVTPDKNLYRLIDKIIKDRVYTFKDGSVVVCDTAAKLQRKVHQLYSGTIIVEDGGTRVHKILDESKANYIKNHLYGGKIAIYYLFQSEGDVLKKTFPNWTDRPEVFNNSDNGMVFIGQFQSSSRGINLSSATTIIFYNIHFSSELYQQARQRGQEKNKSTETNLIWLFTKGGIEDNIYRRVINKQSYTSTYFRKDYL